MLRCLVKPSEPHVLIHHRTITKEEINTQEKIYRRIFHNGYIQAYIPKRPRVIWLAVVDLWCFVIRNRIPYDPVFYINL